VAGDVVKVRAGTYSDVQNCLSCSDNAVLQVVNSGTPSAWISFEAETNDSVILSGAKGAAHGVQVIRTHDGRVPRYVSFKGFTIRDFSSNCVYVRETSDVALSDLDISGCHGGAVELHLSARVTLEDSRIHHNPLAGWTSAVDLYKCQDGNVIRGNRIWANEDMDSRESEGHGLTMDYCQTAGGATIENNIIWGNEGWCIVIFFSDGAIIRNNTCWMNGNDRPETGEISIVGRNHEIYNNILVPRPDRLALNLRERSPEYVGHLGSIRSDFNLMWAPTHKSVVGWSFNSRGSVSQFRSQNSYGWGASDIQANPKLVAPDSQSFHLSANSPALDSGDNSNAAATDIAQVTRPKDGSGLGSSIVDRGAYENNGEILQAGLPDVRKAAGSANSDRSNNSFFEVGTLSANHEWKAVKFRHAYFDPIVVAGPPSYNGGHPAEVRIRNVNSHGFEVRIHEWDYLDGGHLMETLSYLVMERGRHRLKNGTRVEANRFYIDSNSMFHTVPFRRTFKTAPVVIAALNSFKFGEDAVTTRIRRVDTNRFQVRLQEQERNIDGHGQEVGAFIAWEPSSGVVNGLRYEVQRTADSVRHVQHDIVFKNVHTNTPGFLASMQTSDGSDTANLRWMDASAFGIGVSVSEEQSKDSEIIHASESVGYFAFSSRD
jgi:parallel beta-helix repeat protein